MEIITKLVKVRIQVRYKDSNQNTIKNEKCVECGCGVYGWDRLWLLDMALGPGGSNRLPTGVLDMLHRKPGAVEYIPTL